MRSLLGIALPVALSSFGVLAVACRDEPPPPPPTPHASAQASGRAPQPILPPTALPPAVSGNPLGAGAYRSKDGAFAADMACRPTATDDEAHHVVRCPDAPYRTVAWDELSGAVDEKKAIEGARDAFVKSFDQAKIVDEKDALASGHKAHDVTVEITRDGKTSTGVLRVFVADKRLYALSTFDEEPSERARFVGTFTLLH